MHLGDTKAAEQIILSALQIDPEQPYLLCTYARILVAAGLLDKAELVLSEVEKIAPEKTETLGVRYLIAYIRDDKRSLNAYSKLLLKEDPDSALNHMAMGLALVNTGNETEGCGHIMTSAQIDPEDPEIAKIARQSRIATQRMLIPLRPFWKLGMVGTWLLGISGFVSHRLLNWDVAAVVWMFSYLGLCLFSWVGPPLVGWWLARHRP